MKDWEQTSRLTGRRPDISRNKVTVGEPVVEKNEKRKELAKKKSKTKENKKRVSSRVV